MERLITVETGPRWLSAPNRRDDKTHLVPRHSENGAFGQPVDNLSDQRVWVLRVHERATLSQSHAVVSIDWAAGLAHTSCGLGLRPDEIANIPMGGCMPCVLCVAATPRPPEVEQ